MDIVQSISIVHVLFQVGSLTQWLYDCKTWNMRISRLLETYTVIVILGSASLLLYGLFGDNDFEDKANENEIGQTVDFIQMVGIRVAHVVSISEAIVRRSDQKLFYDQVREIDKIFECSLNVDVDNRKFRRRTLQRLAIMLAIYLVSELFILATKLVSTDMHFSLYWIFYLLPFIICGLRYFQIFNSILIIKSRFDKLIAILGQVNLQHDHEAKLEGDPPVYLPVLEITERSNRRYNMENPELKRLLIVRDLYNRLWELSSILNRCFGVSILINVCNDFISITSNCYWIFLNFSEYSSTPSNYLLIAGSAVWTVPHLFNVLVLAIVCERTVRSNTSIALALHRIEIDIFNDNHNTVIEQFSLQLLHQKIYFTAAGFFKVDCTLLYTIVGATTTYLIILIQFHMNETKPSAGG